MNDLKVIGKEHIGQYEFTGIEGGFGKGKRAMTVKDISQIHDTTVKRINELINRNRKRFKDGVDVIDLIGKGNFEVVLNDLGFNQNQINRSAHIYLLSERGYSKLLKILEDDTAWDIYDQLVDNYFNMRQAIQKDSYMIEDPVKRAQRWIEERKAYDKAAVKADYFDKQMHNPGLLTATVIAKEYGKSAVWLNRYLEKLGVVYRQGKNWIIRQKYAGKGYMGYDNWSDESNKHVHPLLKWTQRGKKFIYDLLAQNGILPVIELMQVQQTDLLEGGY